MTQCAAGAAYRDEQLAVTKAERVSAETTHGETGNRPSLAPRLAPIVTVHVTDHILDEVIFPVVRLPLLTGGIVDEPAIARIGQHHDEIVQLARIECGGEIATPHSIVLHIAMEQIEHRIALLALVVALGQHDIELHAPVHRRAIVFHGLQSWRNRCRDRHEGRIILSARLSRHHLLQEQYGKKQGS